ncbi:hypothetical protein EGW08_002686, partial [Elysia chlorotica]
QSIGEFLPRSESEPFENDRFLVESRVLQEQASFTSVALNVHQKPVQGLDQSDAPKIKTLTLLVCKNTDLDPKSVLDLQEKMKSFRPGGKSRVLYTCRTGADQSGLMCVQSILLDRMEADQRLTVPLVVGSVKAIRPQIIPTLEQYECLYRVLRLSHEDQNIYTNL